MTGIAIKTFCLGNGELKCNGCGQEKNWVALDQLPDKQREEVRKKARRIDDTDCILSGRPFFFIPDPQEGDVINEQPK